MPLKLKSNTSKRGVGMPDKGRSKAEAPKFPIRLNCKFNTDNGQRTSDIRCDNVNAVFSKIQK